MSKNKDKKGKESTIGKIIYGFLLFMPLIAIASAVLIGTFNMSTKERAEITYAYETNEVNNESDLRAGNIYHFKLDRDVQIYQNEQFSGPILNVKQFYILNVDNSYIDEIYFPNNEPAYGLPAIYFYFAGTGNYEIGLYTPDNNSYISTYIEFNYDTEYYFEFDIIIESTDFNISNMQDSLINYFSICENIPIKSVETHNVTPNEIFYTSINNVEESNLFNWSKNSIVYTTLVATCNALSITNTFIPMLLAYWLIISVIYILYDIALMMIIILHHKVHCLQDSI